MGIARIDTSRGPIEAKLTTSINVVKATPTTVPFPPRIVPTILAPAQHNWYIPQWLDSQGTWWGAHTTLGLFKSVDYGATWTVALASPNTSVTSYALIISDTGRAIWTCSDGKVYVSDESKTSWTLAFTFGAGYTGTDYGYNKYKNIILLSTYGPTSPTNPPRFVYASFDNGATWAQIYAGPILDAYHIHDVAYDPWADRIWIAEGDGAQSQILYSDNRGSTWNSVYANRGEGVQATQIIPGPYSVIFGKDRNPDGIAIWSRPDSPLQPVIQSADIISDYFKFDTVDTMRHVFRKAWYNIETPNQLLYVLAVGAANTDGYPRILISNDCLRFFEIWKGDKGDGGIKWVVGPSPTDADRKFMACAIIAGASSVIKGNIPQFA